MLHRDIYWLGKQWAVTGYGIQSVNDKHEMRFDVAAAQIWDNDLDAPMRAEPWFDAADFAAALAMARKRSQENPRTFQSPMSDER
ncbi:MAG: hypothetical protein JWP84_1122 [Tardiphaga sp.]|nr:hypothetical protein [Tardiphaga sp.]MDB5634890.1 hypothetical protein [Tardiphaga sp.]